MKNIIITIFILFTISEIKGQRQSVVPKYYLLFDATDTRSETAGHTIFNGNLRQRERVFAYNQTRVAHGTNQSFSQYLLDWHPPEFVTFNKNQYIVVPLSSLYQQYNVKTVANFEVDLGGKNFDAGIAYLGSFDFYIVELLPALGVAHIHKVYCNNSEE